MTSAAEHKLQDNKDLDKGRQIIEHTKQCNSKPNKNVNDNPNTNNKTKQEIDYSIAGSVTEADRVVHSETTLKMHDECSKVFTGIGCFKSTLSLQVRHDAKPYQVPLRHVIHSLLKPLKKY